MLHLTTSRKAASCKPEMTAWPQVRARWLIGWAAKLGFGPDVATAVAKIVLMNSGPDETAAELLDLMGDAAFESIQSLLAVRSVLIPKTCVFTCKPSLRYRQSHRHCSREEWVGFSFQAVSFAGSRLLTICAVR